MITSHLTEQLNSLVRLLTAISSGQYEKKSYFLGDATIGQHTRHVIELFNCLLSGYKTNRVDYVNRKRNLTIETNKDFAIEQIIEIILKVEQPDKVLHLYAEELAEMPIKTVNSTYFRELVYNTEHTIHHFALIKVALKEMNLELVDEHFGMAYSTIQYKKSLEKSFQS
jgi:hypothetical protein